MHRQGEISSAVNGLLMWHIVQLIILQALRHIQIIQQWQEVLLLEPSLHLLSTYNTAAGLIRSWHGLTGIIMACLLTPAMLIWLVPGPTDSYSLNITPPSWALPGQTRMRISLAYGISPPSCGTWQYGEAEDYSVYVCGSISQAASAFSNSPICYGSSSTLGLTGGIISVGANWFWYSGSCGGNYLFSGISGTVNPVVSTNYYVRAQGICSTTVCASTQVQVDPQVPKPSNVTSTSPDICPGDSCYLNGTSPGNIIKWWTASTGGTLVCSSASSANCRIIPSISAVYYAEAYDSRLNSILIYRFCSKLDCPVRYYAHKR